MRTKGGAAPPGERRGPKKPLAGVSLLVRNAKEKSSLPAGGRGPGPAGCRDGRNRAKPEQRAPHAAAGCAHGPPGRASPPAAGSAAAGAPPSGAPPLPPAGPSASAASAAAAASASSKLT
jgi:hypothetical protein